MKKRKGAEPDGNVVSLEMEWARLSRVVAITRIRQSDLEQKLYRAEMVASTAESGHGTNIAILDPAYRPSGPSNAPNKTIVVLGLGVSIAVGLLLCAAWGLLLDDRVFASSEVEAAVMVPVLGVIPRPKTTRKKQEVPPERSKG